MKQSFLKYVMLLSISLGCIAASAQEVKYNYDREANFASYKTYQWDQVGGVASDPLRDRDIRRAIEEQLALKGLLKVESGGDLRVSYQTQLDREKQIEGFTMAPRWSGMGRAMTSTVEVGTLVLSLYDSNKQLLVWRGGVSKTLNVSKDPDKNYRDLEKAVNRLLKNYPPRSER
jgi:Domain of unknown function (DUF4136)